MENLKNEVKQILEQMYVKKNEDEFEESAEKRPFTIRIDEYTHIRLENIAKNLEMTKADVARMILNEGIRSILEEFENFIERTGTTEDTFFDFDVPLEILLGRFIHSVVDSDGDDE